MVTSEPRKTVSVEIDARLAAQYKAAYVHAYGGDIVLNQSIAMFITGFVEDRLSEEIMFIRSESIRESR